jgi:aminoglycoside phosphotransferase (APT) family kinase protein
VPEYVPRDKAETREQLTRWLATKLDDPTGLELSEPGGPVATGFSNETIIFDARWAGGNQGFVVRPKPLGHTLFLEPEFETQYRVLKILARDTDVLVPTVRWVEEDPTVLGAPFFVMDKVEGRIPSDSPPYHVDGWLLEARPEERATLWWSGLEQLMRIHRLDPMAIGLDFLDRPARGAPGLDQQLRYYEEYFAWVSRGRPHPTVTDAHEWLLANKPAAEPLGLVWGDARVGNIIFGDDFRPAAVVDWEMVTLGNPVEDLGWWIFLDRHHSEGMGVPRLEGFPPYDETIATWEKGTGMSAADLDYYQVFAGYRFSVVMMRVIDLVIEFGYAPGDATQGVDNNCSRLLAELLGLPAPATRIG